MVQTYQEAIHHNCFLRIIKEKKQNNAENQKYHF